MSKISSGSAREAGREHPSRLNSEPAPGVVVRGRSGEPSSKPAREAGRADCDVPSLFGAALWVVITAAASPTQSVEATTNRLFQGQTAKKQGFSEPECRAQ